MLERGRLVRTERDARNDPTFLTHALRLLARLRTGRPCSQHEVHGCSQSASTPRIVRAL